MSSHIRPASFRLSHAIVVVTAALLYTVTLSAQEDMHEAPVVTRERISTELITVNQVRSHPDLANAYLVVEALHSNWMRERGVRPRPSQKTSEGWRSVAGENAGVQVYLDGHRMGGTELLRNIPAVTIFSVRHLNGVDAQARFGGGHSEGAILIATKPAWDRIW